MPEIIKAADAADLLRLVPPMLGFVPSNSIVLIPFADNRSIGAMRFDIPDPGDEQSFAVTATGVFVRTEADAVFVIAYTDEVFTDQTVRTTVERVVGFTREAGYTVFDAAIVACDGWGAVLNGDPLPSPLEQIAHDPQRAPMRKNEGEDLPHVGAEILQEVKQALEFETVQADPRVADVFTALSFFDNVAIGEPGMLDSATDIALLAAVMARPSLRDPMILTFYGGVDFGAAALRAQMEWEEDGVEYPAHLARIMWGDGKQPDAERLHAVHRAVHHVAAHVADDPAHGPGVFATLAWVSWAMGRSTEAERWAKQGLALDPEHGLCGIVQSFVNAGHLPAWAFQR